MHMYRQVAKGLFAVFRKKLNSIEGLQRENNDRCILWLNVKVLAQNKLVRLRRNSNEFLTKVTVLTLKRFLFHAKSNWNATVSAATSNTQDSRLQFLLHEKCKMCWNFRRCANLCTHGNVIWKSLSKCPLHQKELKVKIFLWQKKTINSKKKKNTHTGHKCRKW